MGEMSRKAQGHEIVLSPVSPAVVSRERPQVAGEGAGPASCPGLRAKGGPCGPVRTLSSWASASAWEPHRCPSGGPGGLGLGSLAPSQVSEARKSAAAAPRWLRFWYNCPSQGWTWSRTNGRSSIFQGGSFPSLCSPRGLGECGPRPNQLLVSLVL